MGSGSGDDAPSSHAVQHRVHSSATTGYPPNEVSRVAVARGVRRRHSALRGLRNSQALRNGAHSKGEAVSQPLPLKTAPLSQNEMDSTSHLPRVRHTICKPLNRKSKNRKSQIQSQRSTHTLLLGAYNSVSEWQEINCDAPSLQERHTSAKDILHECIFAWRLKRCLDRLRRAVRNDYPILTAQTK